MRRNWQANPQSSSATVNSIKTKELPELDDEFASEVSDFETLEEYKADIRAKLTEQKEKAAKTAKEDALVEKAVEGATMDIPDLMIESQARSMVQDFAQRLQQQGLSMDQYMQYTGSTVEKMIEESEGAGEEAHREPSGSGGSSCCGRSHRFRRGC